MFCPTCKTGMKPLITSWYCPNDCDKTISFQNIEDTFIKILQPYVSASKNQYTKLKIDYIKKYITVESWDFKVHAIVSSNVSQYIEKCAKEIDKQTSEFNVVVIYCNFELMATQ